MTIEIGVMTPQNDAISADIDSPIIISNIYESFTVSSEMKNDITLESNLLFQTVYSNVDGGISSVSDHTILTNRDAEEQHPIDAITGLEDALGDKAQTYTHIQALPSSSWSVNHNLNRFPSVTIIDSSNREVFGQIAYIDSNTLMVTFSASFAGKAYIV